MAVLFANTAGHWYSNAVFGSNVNVPIPASNVGDTLILAGYTDQPTLGLIGSDTGFPTFTSIQSTSASANGSSWAGYKVVDGTEGATARLRLNGSGSANISAVIMRLTGSQRLNPSLGAGTSSANSASDGVIISTGNGTSRLFHQGGMTIATFGSITTNANFNSANVPSGTNLVSANQANVFFSVVYRENPTEITNHGSLTWDVAAGNKRAVAFHILPDVSWIGTKGNTYSTGTLSNTVTQRLYSNDRVAYKAKENEEIHRIGIRVGTSVGGGSDRVQIGVYDVTSGTANAALIANATFTSLTASQFNTIDITPVALVANNKYAVASRSNTTSSITWYTSYLSTPGVRESSQTGTTPLPSTWDFDDGSANDNNQTLWADVRTITEPEPILTDVDGDNTVLAGQQNVTANGSSLSNVANMMIISNTRIAYCAIDSNSSTQLVFDVPSLSSLIASNIKFGNVTFKANTASGLGFPKLGFVYPNSQYQIHDVTDTSKANIAGCIYYGASPAIVVGDQILYSNTSALGYSVTIDGQGFPTIASNTDITDFFSYRVYDVTDSTWGSEGNIVVLGSVGPPAVSRSFRVAKSADGKRYSKFPTGGTYTPTISQNFNSFSEGTSLSGNNPFDAAGRTKANTTTKYGATGASALMSIRTGDLGGFGNWGGILNLPRNYAKNEEIWVRWRQYWPSSFQFTATPYMKFLRFRTDSAGAVNQGYIDLYIDDASGAGVTYRTIKENQDIWQTISNGAIPRDQWITYELYVYLDNVSTDSGGKGRMRFWIDGNLAQDRTDITTLTGASHTVPALYWLTYWNNETPPNNDTYVDDIIVATSDSPPYSYDNGNRLFIGT